MGDTFVDLGSIIWYKKAVEVWSSLQTSDRFYSINAKNFADAKAKLDTIDKTL